MVAAALAVLGLLLAMSILRTVSRMICALISRTQQVVLGKKAQLPAGTRTVHRKGKFYELTKSTI